MFIAFTGSGGSGKTTVARSLYRKLDTRGTNYVHHVTWLTSATRNVFVKCWWAIRFWFFFDRRIFRAYFGYFLRNRERWPKLKDRVYMMYIAPVLTYNLQLLSSGSKNILVYDTDIIVPHSDQFDPERVRDFFTKAILPKVNKLLIVAVNTPHDLSVTRWHQREGKELSEHQKALQVKDRERRHKGSEQVIAAIANLSDVSVLRLDGTEDPELNADKVLRRMDEMYSSGIERQ